MKICTSFNVEKNTLNAIQRYQNENNLTSRSNALERMLIELEFYKKLERILSASTAISAAADIIQNENLNKENSINEILEEYSHDLVKDSVNNTYSDMPD